MDSQLADGAYDAVGFARPSAHQAGVVTLAAASTTGHQVVRILANVTLHVGGLTVAAFDFDLAALAAIDKVTLVAGKASAFRRAECAMRRTGLAEAGLGIQYKSFHTVLTLVLVGLRIRRLFERCERGTLGAHVVDDRAADTCLAIRGLDRVADLAV